MDTKFALIALEIPNVSAVLVGFNVPIMIITTTKSSILLKEFAKFVTAWGKFLNDTVGNRT